jgi:hypothetical protein
VNTLADFSYEGTRRQTYEDGAQFIPVCEKCGRYVKAHKTIRVNGEGLHPEPNADCSKCGPTRMIFEGFVAEGGGQ